jgi:hypothetical protein
MRFEFDGVDGYCVWERGIKVRWESWATVWDRGLLQDNASHELVRIDSPDKIES